MSSVISFLHNLLGRDADAVIWVSQDYVYLRTDGSRSGDVYGAMFLVEESTSAAAYMVWVAYPVLRSVNPRLTLRTQQLSDDDDSDIVAVLHDDASPVTEYEEKKEKEKEKEKEPSTSSHPPGSIPTGEHPSHREYHHYSPSLLSSSSSSSSSPSSASSPSHYVSASITSTSIHRDPSLAINQHQTTVPPVLSSSLSPNDSILLLRIADIRAVRRRTPRMGDPSLQLLSDNTPPSPPFYFQDGGMQDVFDALRRRIHLQPAPADPDLHVVHHPSPRETSLHSSRANPSPIPNLPWRQSGAAPQPGNILTTDEDYFRAPERNESHTAADGPYYYNTNPARTNSSNNHINHTRASSSPAISKAPKHRGRSSSSPSPPSPPPPSSSSSPSPPSSSSSSSSSIPTDTLHHHHHHHQPQYQYQYQQHHIPFQLLQWGTRVSSAARTMVSPSPAAPSFHDTYRPVPDDSHDQSTLPLSSSPPSSPSPSSLPSSALPSSDGGFEVVGGTDDTAWWDAGADLPPRASPVDDDEWTELVAAGDASRARRRIYAGGCHKEVRRKVWRWLSGWEDPFMRDSCPDDDNNSNNSNNNNNKQDRNDNSTELEPTRSCGADWEEEQRRRYYVVRRQWRSMLPEQKARFREFRERMSQVEKDAVRTDRQHEYYAGEDNVHITMLRDILMSYVMYNWDLGYCQGMNDILSPILYVMEDEAVAFWVFARVMDRWSGNFTQDQRSMHQQLSRVGAVLATVDPEFYAYLEEHHAQEMFFCFRWLLVLFKREFSLEDVLRLWDVFLTAYPVPDLQVYAAVALLQRCRGVVMGRGLEVDSILRCVHDMSGAIGVDTLLRHTDRIRETYQRCTTPESHGGEKEV